MAFSSLPDLYDLNRDLHKYSANDPLAGLDYLLAKVIEQEQDLCILMSKYGDVESVARLDAREVCPT
jgi:hypothetical protein